MKATWIVLDGVGVGALPDAAAFGDEGSDTLGHVAESVGGLCLPNLGRLGLGNLHAILGVPPRRAPDAAYGRMVERSVGKDSTAGHWEMAGIVLQRPFPTYPRGFPDDVVRTFTNAIGRDVIGNVAASGTQILAELGDEHVRTGALILYTSADSVFQVAAHESIVPREELYAFCRAAREILTGHHAVGRVIARPFEGESGAYERTAGRKDFGLAPPAPTIFDRLAERGVPVFGVGKVGELFAGRGFLDVLKATSNAEAIEATLTLQRELEEGVIFVNLIDFDTRYGHRNDPKGFARALESFDDALEEISGRVRGDDLLVLTADHGNDPTTPSTDHSREHVPLLVLWPRGRSGVDLGTRRSFADLGQTVGELFDTAPLSSGESFLRLIR